MIAGIISIILITLSLALLNDISLVFVFVVSFFYILIYSLALKKDNKLFDEYIGNNFGLLVFDNSINIVNEIKKLSSSSIFGKNIFHIDETNEFNKDKKIFKWSKVNNISAAIIRPDKHIYGCVDNTNIINDIDQLTNKLISEIQ